MKQFSSTGCTLSIFAFQELVTCELSLKTRFDFASLMSEIMSSRVVSFSKWKMQGSHLAGYRIKA